MKQRCANCSRPLLDSDEQCYHCGAPVPGRQLKETPAKETVDLRAAARYAGVVLGLLVLGSLLMSWMGAGISVQNGPSPTPAAPDGWREFIPPEDDYAIWLPDSWELHTPAGPQWDTLLARADQPLPGSFQRTEPALVADRVSLLASGRSPDEPDAEAEAVSPLAASVQFHPGLANAPLAALQTENWSAGGRSIDTTGGISTMPRKSGETVLIAELITRQGGDLLHTLTMILTTGRGTYAVTVSAEETAFWQEEGILWDILDSFRPLP
jgi:hypothetical protein